jgi:4-carboxymuconolactone decarboxylase
MEVTMGQEQYEAGLRERKAVLGADYVDKALAAADSFNRDFQQMVTEYCWGGTWGRGVLTRKERSLINLVMLSALNRPHEFKIHVRGALTNGLTLDEIREALHVVAVYCGIPAGVEAFRLAREVLDEKGIKPPK